MRVRSSRSVQGIVDSSGILNKWKRERLEAKGVGIKNRDELRKTKHKKVKA